MREDVPALVSMIEESAKRGANVVKQVFTFAQLSDKTLRYTNIADHGPRHS